MKQKIFLSESELYNLVENCVYTMLNENRNESISGGIKNVLHNRKNSLEILKHNGFKNFKDNVIDDYQDGYYTEGFQKCINLYLKMLNAYNNGKKFKYQIYKEDLDNLLQKYGFDYEDIKLTAEQNLQQQ